jgi:hypothetical protein
MTASKQSAVDEVAIFQNESARASPPCTGFVAFHLFAVRRRRVEAKQRLGHLGHWDKKAGSLSVIAGSSPACASHRTAQGCRAHLAAQGRSCPLLSPFDFIFQPVEDDFDRHQVNVTHLMIPSRAPGYSHLAARLRVRRPASMCDEAATARQRYRTDVASRDQPLGRHYFGCCSVFGLAASSARLAIHASYSGVPRRGGVSDGRPPIACGIKSPTCTLLQDGNDRTARQKNADWIALATRFISGLCHRIVARGAQRGRSLPPCLPHRKEAPAAHPESWTRLRALLW